MTSPRDAKHIHKAALFAQRGVVGVGVGDLDSHMPLPHLHVYVESPYVPVPSLVAGVPVHRVVTGKIGGLSLTVHQLANQARLRPYPGGASIGSYSSLLSSYLTGTLAMPVRDSSGNVALLSNNHVMVMDTLQHGGAGQDVIQPGPADSGTDPVDRIATPQSWVPLDEQGENLTDAAVSSPADPDQVDSSVLGIGVVRGSQYAAAGLPVIKSGRTTGLTASTIVDVDAAISVSEGPFNFMFEHQLVIDNLGASFAQTGDSGAVVVDSGTLRAVGLLFAGSGSIAVANRIENVLSALSITVPGGIAPAPSPSSLVPLGFIGLGTALYLWALG